MILAIDPSINNTGWAVGSEGIIAESGVVKTGGAKFSVAERLQKLHESIINIRARQVCCDAIIEVPGSFTYARSADGQKPLNAPAIAKLNMAIGAIMVSLADCKIHTVEAHIWKGKMSKEQSCRVAAVSNHNRADAINLLRWFEAGWRKNANL